MWLTLCLHLSCYKRRDENNIWYYRYTQYNQCHYRHKAWMKPPECQNYLNFATPSVGKNLVIFSLGIYINWPIYLFNSKSNTGLKNFIHGDLGPIFVHSLFCSNPLVCGLKRYDLYSDCEVGSAGNVLKNSCILTARSFYIAPPSSRSSCSRDSSVFFSFLTCEGKMRAAPEIWIIYGFRGRKLVAGRARRWRRTTWWKRRHLRLRPRKTKLGEEKIKGMKYSGVKLPLTPITAKNLELIYVLLIFIHWKKKNILDILIPLS